MVASIPIRPLISWLELPVAKQLIRSLLFLDRKLLIDLARVYQERRSCEIAVLLNVCRNLQERRMRDYRDGCDVLLG